MRKTKIICTLGPSSDRDNVLENMFRNGMNCARFNFSHGTHPEHKVRIERVRNLCRSSNVNIPLLLDTKGPEIRLGIFASGSEKLTEGQSFTLTPDDIQGTSEISSITYKELAEHVKPGDTILIDDGKIAVTVDYIKGRDVVCRVMNGGTVSNRKSLNLPGIVIPMPYLRDADKKDILFGIQEDFDFIAASFVRSADDVLQLREFLRENGGESIKIISKIENKQGLENLDAIIEASDGIMVARGDLGVEIPFRFLPAIQKEIIEKCNTKGKFVVTATQMLESMTHSLRPTRAEVSDVANAIYDGTTAIMLSGESASGDYPAETVKTMSEIAEAAEKSINYEDRFKSCRNGCSRDFTHAIGHAACDLVYSLDAKAIIVVTRSGKSALNIAAHRPNCPVIAVTLYPKGCRQLNFAWGVYPVLAEELRPGEDIFDYGVKKALETGIVKEGDLVGMVAGSSQVKGELSDMIKVDII